MPVVGAVEVQNGGPGRIRPAKSTGSSASSPHAVIAVDIAPGTTVKTAGPLRPPPTKT